MTTAPSGATLSRIGQIFVRARDLDRAIVFYRDTLGVPFLLRVPGMAFFRCGDASLMLGVPESPEFDHPSSILYFDVEDIGAAYDTLKGRGVEFKGPPHVVHKAPDHDLWMAFFLDADGNTMALMCRKPRG